MENPQHVRFERVDLSRVSFLRTDVSQMDFVGCTWSKLKRSLLWPLPLRIWPLPFDLPGQTREAVFDEVMLDTPERGPLAEDDRRLVAEEYRHLRLNYESKRQEAEAGHFYIGQMEMRRRDYGYSWAYRFILGIYRVLATYGESYGRPAFFYWVFGGVVFALFYLWSGFQAPGGAQVRYSLLAWDLGDPWPFIRDFVPAYVQALTAGGILGNNLSGLSGVNLASGSWWVPMVRFANMLLDTFLVGFFVIALRRHFRR